MDGLKFIAAALDAGSIASLSEVEPEMLQDSELTVFEFVKDHCRRYREMPAAQTIQEELNVRLPRVTETLQYYIDRVNERHDYNLVRDRFAIFREGLHQKDMGVVASSVAEMSRVLRRRRGGSKAGEIVRIDDGLRQVAERLESIKGTGGVSGITTGWRTYDTITGGYQRGDLITLVGRMGVGKCMDPATPVLMFGGAIKPIGKLKVGDQLTGPDSLPRTVLSTTTGRDPMYRITPTRGEPFICNGAHILVLACDFHTDAKHTKGSTHQYTVDEFLALPQRVRQILRLVKVAVEFPESEVEVSPYYTGVWLGDGCVQNGRISTIDPEIRQAVYDEAARFGMAVVQQETREGFCPQYALVNGRGKEHTVMDFLRGYCYRGGEKRIPGSYLRNSRAIRLEVLAGIVDTDGSLHANAASFEVVTKYAGLRDDIMYLARSLGLCAKYIDKAIDGATYYRVYLSGNISMIPTRLPRKQAPERARRCNVLHQPFTVEPLGVGDYAGITLDGDHLYLLGDFTVTHNTYIALKQAKAAHQDGENVLFVTTEMGSEQLARRYAAIEFGINPTLLKSGNISTHIQRRISSFCRDMAGADRFRMFSVGMNAKTSAIEALCQEFGPSVVFIDGIYLLRPTEGNKNMNRTERITAVYDEVKALTLDTDTPFIAVSQFNRQAGKGGKEGSLENIGYTDAIGTHSSIVVALKYGPTQNPKQSRAMEFLKGREGEDGEVVINFRFAPLDMSEMSAEQREAEGDAGESTTAWMGATGTTGGNRT